MDFRVLGPFEVMADGVALGLGGPKQRTVLAALVLRANEVVPTDALVEALWGHDVPDSAVGMVRTYVSRLRRALSVHGGDGAEARVLGRPPGYVLEVDPERVDARCFERLVTEGREDMARGRPEAAADTLGRALGLWRGDVVADLAGRDVFRPAAARLEEMRLAAMEDVVDAELALGHHAEVIGELELLTGEHPFRERFWGQLMAALYRSGRQADALAAYRAVRTLLIEQMGLEPGPQLRVLERQVLSQADELRWRPPGGGPAPDAGVARQADGAAQEGDGSWPTPGPPFFGREAEVSELASLINRERFVTVVGSPGCGKTRLAIEVGSTLAPAFTGGRHFVELAPIAEGASVTQAVGAAVGVGEEPGRPIEQTLVEALGGDAPQLLVLDNCEHVAEPVARLVRRLLADCPHLRVLATSRAGLGRAGLGPATESVWHLPPLDPASAARLFVDRATAARGPLHLDRTDETTVGQICDGLDGLPLAIELVAAWTRLLSLGQIADRLARALPLLSDVGGGQSRRHATMAATVRWSFQLLPPDAQHLFVRLSVFAGGFDLEAVEAVVAGGGERGDGDGDRADGGRGRRDVLAGLAALVDHSLVVADTPASGRTRYRCLEPIRQCGAALLDASDDADADEARRRHAEHYLAVARRFDPWGLRRVRRALPADRLEREEGNLLAALEWAATRPSDLALELCEALATFWEIGGRVNNGRSWMERLLARDEGDPGLRARALTWAGRLAWRQGDYDGARRLLGESRALLSRHDERSTPFTAGLVRRIEASVAFSDGDAEAAVRLCQESIALARSVDDEIGLIWSHYTLGWAHYVLGDVARGDEQMWAALTANRRVRHPTATANAHFGLQYGAFLAGDTAAQRAHLLAALAAAREPAAFLDESEWLWCGAVLAAVEGRFASALRVVGGATALSRRHSSRQPEQIVARMLTPFEATATEVTADDAARLRAEGGRMSWEELVAEVLGEPPTGGSPLTTQEREVTDLVAGGLTNADIAQKLAVPRRAVDSHIERVKQKLGLDTRDQILTRVLAERRRGTSR